MLHRKRDPRFAVGNIQYLSNLGYPEKGLAWQALRSVHGTKLQPERKVKALDI